MQVRSRSADYYCYWAYSEPVLSLPEARIEANAPLAQGPHSRATLEQEEWNSKWKTLNLRSGRTETETVGQRAYRIWRVFLVTRRAGCPERQ